MKRREHRIRNALFGAVALLAIGLGGLVALAFHPVGFRLQLGAATFVIHDNGRLDISRPNQLLERHYEFIQWLTLFVGVVGSLVATLLWFAARGIGRLSPSVGARGFPLD